MVQVFLLCLILHKHVCTSVVLHQDNLVVCVVCSCCATSPYREVCKAREGSGVERPCAMIFTLLVLSL